MKGFTVMKLFDIRPIQVNMITSKLFNDIGFGKDFFQEAVFTKGRDKLKKLDDAWKPLQEKLRIEVETQKRILIQRNFTKMLVGKT